MAAYVYGTSSYCYECCGSGEAEGWRSTLEEAITAAQPLAEPGRPSWVDVLNDDGTIGTVWTSDAPPVEATSRIVDISPATPLPCVSYPFGLDAQ